MGVTNAELWANLGLCCFYSSQYDMCLGCLDQVWKGSVEDKFPPILVTPVTSTLSGTAAGR